MSNTKTVITPITQQFKSSITQIPSTEVEMAYIDSISYASIMGFLMYDMVYTRPDLAYAVILVRRYMTNPRKPH